MNKDIPDRGFVSVGLENVVFEACGRRYSAYLPYDKTGRFATTLAMLDDVCRVLQIRSFSEIRFPPGVRSIDVYAGRILFGTFYPGFFFCSC